MLNERAAVRLSDADDLDYQCPIELEDTQNHLIKEASEAEWNELEHVTIKLSQGARDYFAGYMAVKVSTESEWGSVFFVMKEVTNFTIYYKGSVTFYGKNNSHDGISFVFCQSFFFKKILTMTLH